jgi:hypothetical protein
VLAAPLDKLRSASACGHRGNLSLGQVDDDEFTIGLGDAI